MVKVVSKKLEKIPTWGGLFNHTIIIKEKENTKFLDLFVV